MQTQKNKTNFHPLVVCDEACQPLMYGRPLMFSIRNSRQVRRKVCMSYSIYEKWTNKYGILHLSDGGSSTHEFD